MTAFKALILAGEGPSLSRERETPSCLQPLLGGLSLLEQQLKTLRLFGIDFSSIYIAAGNQGNWSADSKSKLYKIVRNQISTFYSDLNSTQTSESTFYHVLPSLDCKSGLLCINSDSLFDISHLEQLTFDKNKCSILTAPPITVNQRGIKITENLDSSLSSISLSTNQKFPWLLYAGLVYLTSDVLSDISSFPPCPDDNGLIYYIDRVIGLSSFSNVRYYSSDTPFSSKNQSSFDLTGGSFASLDRQHLVKKIATGSGYDKLVNEIDWLLSLNNPISSFFPQVLNTVRTSTEVSFEMPWYNYSNLRKNILTGRFSASTAWNFMIPVVSFLERNLYSSVFDRKPDFDWFCSIHIQRVLSRLSSVYLDSSVLKSVIDYQYVLINNQKFLNLPQALHLIFSKVSFLRSLCPPTLCMIHGDLHFQNILCGNPYTDSGFLLADPRGDLNGSDIFYDMGKLWHSFNGLYDLIHTDLYDVSFSITDKCVLSLNFPDQSLLNAYGSIKQLAYEYFDNSFLNTSQSSWYAKTLFAECMHFSSVLPFHLNNKKSDRRALALYIRATQLCNEFISIFNLSSFASDPSYLKLYPSDLPSSISLNLL